MAATRLPLITNNPSKIQIERIAHVYFEHSDLDSFAKFAIDFGFDEAWRSDDTVLFRGYGKDPYCYVAKLAAEGSGPKFGGGAFLVQSESDFVKAASIPGALVSDLSAFPGGGRKVSLKSPSGFPIHVLWGQEDRSTTQTVPSAVVESLGPLNGSLEKRRLGTRYDF
jgi:hypothetical protein